jgi:hypothetical protein
MTPKALGERIQAAFETMLIQTPARQRLRSRPGWTMAVKTVMGDVGKSLGYYVSSAGYPRADQGEFLYDMIWYMLDPQGFILRQQMIMECEWGIAPPTIVDDDFQKLVQARSDVRMWVSNSANVRDVHQHIANCEKQIRLFDGSRAGDQYVLLYLEWGTGTHVLTTLEHA